MKPGTRNAEHDVADVVLLHGWGMNAGIWDDLSARLGARLRVHALDLPGYGATPACAPYTLEAIADAIARAAPPRCRVVGWSLGGQVALTWARCVPRQVERLVLIATTPSFVRRHDWPHAVEASVLGDFARALKTDYTGTLNRFLLLQAQGDTKAKQVALQLRAALSARGEPSAEALERGLEILLNADLRENLGSIAQPTLVLHGDHDTLAPVAAGEHLGRKLPDARVAVLRGAAHVPFVSNLGEVCSLLTDFFDER